jgi:hypothetical protein
MYDHNQNPCRATLIIIKKDIKYETKFVLGEKIFTLKIPLYCFTGDKINGTYHNWIHLYFCCGRGTKFSIKVISGLGSYVQIASEHHGQPCYQCAPVQNKSNVCSWGNESSFRLRWIFTTTNPLSTQEWILTALVVASL